MRRREDLTPEERQEHMTAIFEKAFDSNPENIYHATGYWSDTSGFDINLSSELTFLMKEAAKYCENYASDLFISWNSLLRCLKNFEGSKFEYHVFGFRKQGVDHDSYVYCNLEDYMLHPEFIRQKYGKVYILRLERKGRDIETLLRDVTDTLDFWEYDTPEYRRDLAPFEMHRMLTALQYMEYEDMVRPNSEYNAAHYPTYSHAPELCRLFETSFKRITDHVYKNCDAETVEKWNNLAERVESVICSLEERLDGNEVIFVPTDHPPMDTLENVVKTWFMGKAAGEFYKARNNNWVLSHYLCKQIGVEFKNVEQY